MLLPIEFQIKTFRIAVEIGMNLSEAHQQRLNQINGLDEMRQDALQHIDMVQHQRARWHDKFIRKKQFQEGDWALLFDSQFNDFRGKLTTRWLGPYEVEQVFDNSSVRIRTIDHEKVSFLVNGHRLRLYQKPMSKGQFISDLQNHGEFKIMGVEELSSTTIA